MSQPLLQPPPHPPPHPLPRSGNQPPATSAPPTQQGGLEVSKRKNEQEVEMAAKMEALISGVESMLGLMSDGQRRQMQAEMELSAERQQNQER